MNKLVQIGTGDRTLLDDISASMEEAVRRGGDWIACKPGCTQCCIGPFAITALDAWRLREGMRQLDVEDPERAGRVRERAAAYIRRIAPDYPGDAMSGVLDDEDALPEEMDEVECPALDPGSGLCDVYAFRPITCRTFGPATRVGNEAFGACELCYDGAAEEEIAACAVEIDAAGRETQLLDALAQGDETPMTIVAYAIV